MLFFILDPQLERSGKPRLYGSLQPIRKYTANLLWADQVELARMSLSGSKCLAERLRDLVSVLAHLTNAITKPSHFLRPTVWIAVASRRDSSASMSNSRRVP